MLDPVIKIDMSNSGFLASTQHEYCLTSVCMRVEPTGTFEPAFAAAIFQHIAQNINPAPKNIVLAYVGADVTA
jgi:hypothetical protein